MNRTEYHDLTRNIWFDHKTNQRYLCINTYIKAAAAATTTTTTLITTTNFD
jgi:hypothetical protein